MECQRLTARSRRLTKGVGIFRIRGLMGCDFTSRVPILWRWWCSISGSSVLKVASSDGYLGCCSYSFCCLTEALALSHYWWRFGSRFPLRWSEVRCFGWTMCSERSYSICPGDFYLVGTVVVGGAMRCLLLFVGFASGRSFCYGSGWMMKCF